MLNTPVLFLIFNRPHLTRQSFATIRQAQPKQLFIAADGPRLDRPNEKKLCEQTRKIVEEVDWECEVFTFYSEHNKGCRYAILDAIDWFFSNVEYGIIMEDDCIATDIFFKYCEWALHKFKDDKKIWQVNGNNFNCPENYYYSDLELISLAQAWGWATWANRWSKLTENSFYLEEESKKFKNWRLSYKAKFTKYSHIPFLQKGLDTWDYQWQITILNHFGYCLSFKWNLISNIGDGEDATHTKKDSRIGLKIKETGDYDFDKISSSAIRFNPIVNRYYEKMMGLHNIGLFEIFKWYTNNLIDLKSYIKNKSLILRYRHLFPELKPVVIASSGRSGSTILFGSIIDAYQKHTNSKKLGFYSKILLRNKNIPYGFTKRLADNVFLVAKTHDIAPEFLSKLDYKFIFIYGEPLESALSVDSMVTAHGRQWLEEHQYNLFAKGKHTNLFSEDILNHKGQIQTWLNQDSQNLLCINYTDLWNKEKLISDFLGVSIRLPEKKDRAQKKIPHTINNKLFDKLFSIMRTLEHKHNT